MQFDSYIVSETKTANYDKFHEAANRIIRIIKDSKINAVDEKLFKENNVEYDIVTFDRDSTGKTEKQGNTYLFSDKAASLFLSKVAISIVLI